MHEVKAKSILSKKNNMNIYRGCTHGCIYCDSRSKCYNINHAFEDIEVKSNAVELLEDALKRKRNKCMITTGAMTDPYIPLEKELENTKKCLEIIYKYGFGVSLLTKSDLILRDIDLLDKINKKSKCIVQMTLTTYDENLCKILEPNVATTKRRFEVLKEMQKMNIPTIVWLTPILPFINDSKENILGILDYCIDAKVYGIITFGIGMTLRYGSREYFFENVDKYFDGLKQKYWYTFLASYNITSPNSDKLSRLIRNTCKKNNIIYGTKKVFEYINLYEEKLNTEQFNLFDI